ncbi:hypothetical protein K2173_014953 [Erythroxylum novogranatense]|uniref:Uncharacterized protein n=1 Tax=Erythroxylum novogranatense TaxID=1862640 RepID=A0AAV8TXB2_9ROSI|nr:hypothetical protein K2173_014953 [Erythroxylum novogranatense]
MAKIVSNPLSFSPRYCLQLGSNSQLCLDRVQTNAPRVCCCCSSTDSLYANLLNSYLGAVFKDVGHCNTGFRQLGFEKFRNLAVSDVGPGGGGPGGSPGGGGDGGGGNSGGRGEGHDFDADGGGQNLSFISWYLTLLAEHPVWTKAVTSAVLTLLGDLICGLVIEQVASPDFKRTFLFTFLGFALVGPKLHFWYLYLSKLMPKPGATGALSRLLLDQFLFSPTFIGVFLSTLATQEGKASQVVPKRQQEWFSAVLANWQLWIPFRFLNFRFVPQQFQVLAANVIALAWNVILSFKAHKKVLSK